MSTKRTLFKTFIAATFAFAVFGTSDAIAKCSGRQIGTDAVSGETIGCKCIQGKSGVARVVQKGEKIMGAFPNVQVCNTSGINHWVSQQTMCPGFSFSSFDASRMESEPQSNCWAYKCKEGFAFPQGDKSKCEVPPPNSTVVNGVSINIKCTDATEVIHNGKCMPVCKVALADFDISDDTQITITVGEQEKSQGTEMDPLLANNMARGICPKNATFDQGRCPDSAYPKIERIFGMWKEPKYRHCVWPKGCACNEKYLSNKWVPNSFGNPRFTACNANF